MKYKVNDGCIGCGLCEAKDGCPVGAIEEA